MAFSTQTGYPLGVWLRCDAHHREAGCANGRGVAAAPVTWRPRDTFITYPDRRDCNPPAATRLRPVVETRTSPPRLALCQAGHPGRPGKHSRRRVAYGPPDKGVDEDRPVRV